MAATPAAPMSSPGKRKAVKPAKAGRTLPRRPQTPPPADFPATAPPVARHEETATPTPRMAPPARRSEPDVTETRILEVPRTAAPETRRPATQVPDPRSPAEPAAPSRPTASTARRAASASRAAAAARPARRTTPLAAGRGSGRKTGLAALPSAPTIVGAAALVIAAAGAVTVNDSPEQVAAAENPKMFTPASAMTGTSAGTSSGALDDRLRAVSRDSQRAALKDAANDDLQAEVEAQAKERNAALAQLAENAEKYAGQIAANAWHLPVASAAYHLTAGFGESSGLWANTHTGLDFAAPTGTPVMAVANGTIRSAGWAGAYGNRIVVGHEDGTETWYCHLSAFSVNVGETVRGGQQVGLVGATGNVTGPHLHLEVRPGAGDPVDPFAALEAHGLTP